ncbi:hypothetical protein KVR01_011478 [Diaporthe batatas]|uniref:uncharacterized protein n=1 Tax=Diaporthe batatas TaxID=748121 RepID=UPI001D042ECD|nr:uncharacterized protein KVR01_011478 [Diaporthe batatas]KAG8159035.1 hypothetical protein KVR01_011478 [Diaporthe batatas]
MNRPLIAGPTPGPASKACMNCAKVKCKCIYRQDGLGCERQGDRCIRLKKECVPSTLVRRHKPRGKAANASRTLRLEEKLDDLVSLLRAERGRPSLSSNRHRPGVEEDEEHDDDEQQHDEEDSGDEAEDHQETFSSAIPTPPTTNGTSSTTCVTAAPSPEWVLPNENEPSSAAAQEALNKFRNETVFFFPFVYITPHTSSRQLCETYPFFYLNIMSVTATSNQRRLALGDQARSIIFQRVVIEREKSMDLLLGLLTYLGWSHLQRREKIYTSLFSQLIVLMIHNLGLHQPPPTEESPKVFCGPHPQPSGRQERSNDERRAVLGAFLITSMSAHILKGPDGLRWSSHLDEYATHLAQNSNLDQDRGLIALVRMQTIVNQLQNPLFLPAAGLDTCEVYLGALRSQLQSIMANEHLVSSAVWNHPVILEHFHFTELLILESSIAHLQQPLRRAPLSDTADLRRFEVYQGQLNSIRSWLNTFHTTDFRLYGDMVFFSYSELVRVMVCLHKLTTLDNPPWYSPAVRKSLDLIPALDKLIATFEQLRAAATAVSPPGAAGEDEAFGWAISVFQSMKATWKDEVAALDDVGGGGGADLLGGDGGGFLTAPAYGSSYGSAFGSGDAWLTDMFNMRPM